MYFMVGFYEAAVLQDAAGHALRGRFPHLRFCPVDTIPYLSILLESLPLHISDIVLHGESGKRQINVLLTAGAMPVPSYLQLSGARVVTWSELEAAYRRWLEEYYLPCNAVRMMDSPMALKPVQETFKPLEVELIGGCSGQEMQLKFQEAARELGIESRTVLTVRNAPLPVSSQESLSPPAPGWERIRVVIPPFRAMHPRLMDLYYCSGDSDLFFQEAQGHLLAYLDAVTPREISTATFVIGFVEPTSNPLGLFMGGGGRANFRRFVRELNEATAAWCATRPGCYFIDADAVAAAVGKSRVDDGLVNFSGHRGFLLDYDAPLDADFPVTDIPVTMGFEIGIDLYLEQLIRGILLRQIILTTEARIKLVIIDLDNTLWRGLASDMRIGSWEGRPLAIVEALLILRKRGILLAIASKNDEAFIRERWREILGSYAVAPLTIPLTLDDFALVRINFRPKPESIGEILELLNILPEQALFIDDNPLERESAIAAFPALRTLGAELNYLRRELLCSPYLQSVTITAEDSNRWESIRKRVAFRTQSSESGRGSYLDHLGLRCTIGPVHGEDEAGRERAQQLLNKTNQWNLNGVRVSDAGMARYFVEQRVYSAEVAGSGSSYGTVAVVLLDEAGQRVESMAISCRVIGLGVDEAVVSELCRRFGPLTFAFAETERNRAARAFFLASGWNGVALPVIQALAPPSHIVTVWDESEPSRRGAP